MCFVNVAHILGTGFLISVCWDHVFRPKCVTSSLKSYERRGGSEFLAGGFDKLYSFIYLCIDIFILYIIYINYVLHVFSLLTTWDV